MNTKQLYKELDLILVPGAIYNLRKIPNYPIWKVKVFNEKEFDTKGILCGWIEYEIHPDHQDWGTIIRDFEDCCRQAIAGFHNLHTK